MDQPQLQQLPTSISNQPGTSREQESIFVKGAREHNLKNIDVAIPKKRFVVITGVSGSGKSSLAFDTVFAEGQRRYVESLSAYARQFLGQMEKPKVEAIRGLAPTISIEQKAASKNPRSTVGTITEIYDYLRVLYARIGRQHCYKCGKAVGRGHAQSMVQRIVAMPEGTKILLLAPLIEGRKGIHKELFQQLRGEGFNRVRIDGIVHEVDDVQTLAKHKKHNIEVVIDRLTIRHDNEMKQRLTESVEQALKKGNGRFILHVHEREDIPMSEARTCCGIGYPELDPPLFSFNAPKGMCPCCNGLGTMLAMDEEKIVPDPTLSIREGAVLPWRNYFLNGGEDRESSWHGDLFKGLEKQFGVNFDLPWKKLSQKHKRVILEGAKGAEIKIKFKGKRSQGSWTIEWEGLLEGMMRRYQQTKSDMMKSWYAKFMSTLPCQECEGRRLKVEALHVLVNKKSIIDVCDLTIRDAHSFLSGLELSEAEYMIARDLLLEINNRLGFLLNVGLDYLSMGRKGPTLSGGEAQRIRLASQIGSELTGVLYVLDEPSIGLHQRDNLKLLRSLQHLRDIGNSLLVVEHDQETIEAADWVIDMGPGAGHLGGQIVGAGTPKQLAAQANSLTGQYLKGERQIKVPAARRPFKPGKSPALVVRNASENNLQNIDVTVPLGVMTCITGVSGAGKSSLVNQILFPALARHFHDADTDVGEHDAIEGLDHIDKVIAIDQKPIGRTPRSNPATYTKLFDLIRDFFALLPESRTRGYEKGRFSFNVKGGRCEHCQGDGFIAVEMHFLADVLIPCEVCRGRRFNDATLEVKYKSHSIADILDLSVAQALDVFKAQPRILDILRTLNDVGLSYIKLGQSATTLSGGEAQRVKLAKELSRRDTGKTLYILDEPSTGLHFEDISKLMEVLQRLVNQGNSVVVIEHNLDIVKCADWIVDLGPEGGERGGLIVAEGTPEVVATVPGSYTGQFLKPILDKAARDRLSLS